nr:alpha-(1,6)-fucosyltransferase-like [Penaeus vannamei]
MSPKRSQFIPKESTRKSRLGCVLWEMRAESRDEFLGCQESEAGERIGSQLHHLSYCFLASYGTQRTLILDTKNYNGNPEGLETFFLPLSDTCTSYNKSQMVAWPGKKDSLVVRFPSMDRPNPRPNYFPKSIPKDISERLVRLHGDPFAWWMGQFFKYAMRTNKDFQDYIDNQAREKWLRVSCRRVNIPKIDI